MAEVKTKDRMQEVRTLFLEMASCCRPGASKAELARVDELAPKIGGKLNDLFMAARRDTDETGKLELGTKAHDLGSTLQLIHSCAHLVSRGREEFMGFPMEKKLEHLLVEFEMMLSYDETVAKKEKLDLRQEVESFLAIRYHPALKFEGESFAVNADKVAVWRIFKNLMKNAEEAGAKNITIRFSGSMAEFIDDGKGMPKEVTGQLFTPFFTYGKAHGTGLGLVSVKEQLDRMGATISVKSEEGKGTVFTIDFSGALASQ